MVLWLRMGVLKEPPSSSSLWLRLSVLRLQSVLSPRKVPCSFPGMSSLLAGSGCSRSRLGSRLCSASSQRSEMSLRMASTSAQSCPAALNNSSRLLLAVALSSKGSAVAPQSWDCVIISFYKIWGRGAKLRQAGPPLLRGAQSGPRRELQSGSACSQQPPPVSQRPLGPNPGDRVKSAQDYFRRPAVSHTPAPRLHPARRPGAGSGWQVPSVARSAL